MYVDDSAFSQLINAISSSLAPISVNVDPIPPAPQRDAPSRAALRDFVRSSIEEPNPELTADLGGRLTEIPFKYIADGCYARAHIMAMLMQAHDIDNAKMFVIGSLSAANEVFPKGVSWWYHVAPVVVTVDNGTPSLCIVDPSIAEDPLVPSEWIRNIDRKGNAVELRCRDRAAFYPNGDYPSFEANVPRARAVLEKYARRLGIRFDHFAAGGQPELAPVHEHDGVPWHVDTAAMTVTFLDSALLYRITDASQLAALEAAYATSQIVHIEADPETGIISSVE